MTEREFAREVVQRLQDAGYQALWAGGCVRDELLGLTPADYDVATSARPEQVQAIFRRCHLVGASFGVVEVLGPRDTSGAWLTVQVATFRSDGQYSDGRHPDQVVYSSAMEDAQRRDFTINGLFLDPLTGEIWDYVQGRADLEARLLRAIGNPVERFTEDKLRLLRAARMAARFQFTIEPNTASAATQMASQIAVVSAERIAEELRKMLAHPTRAIGAKWLLELQLAEKLFPSVFECNPSQWHEHILPSLAALPELTPFPVALAVILVGLSPMQVLQVTRDFRLANQERDRVIWLLRSLPMVSQAVELTPSQSYPVLAHPGIGELLAFARALHPLCVKREAGAKQWEAILEQVDPAQLNPPPLLTGEHLKARGWKPGPQFKQALDAVRAAQLDGKISTFDDANQWLDQWLPSC